MPETPKRIDPTPGRIPQASAVPTAVRIALVALYAVLALPPATPLPWKAGLDSSWIIGINEATRSGMVYGRDVAFTYGPLGFVVAPLETGNNFPTAVAFFLVIHVLACWAVARLVFLCRDAGTAALFVCVLTLSGFQTGSLEYTLLITALLFLALSWLTQAPLAALPAAVVTGLAFLVKFNIGVSLLLAWFSWVLLHLLSRERRAQFGPRLLVLATTAAVTTLVLFRIYGGPIEALPDFFSMSLEMASGYSAQMTQLGRTYDFAVAGAQVALLGLAVLMGGWFDRRFLALGLMVAGPLFLTFKSSFVRADPGHVCMLLRLTPALGGLLLPLPEDRRGRVALGLVAAALLGLAAQWQSSDPVLGWHMIPDVPRALGSYASLLPAGRDAARAAAADSRAQDALSDDLRARIGDATVDAYPWDVSQPVNTGLNWKPRPVFQSYSAYTPRLDAANARHYQDPDGPRYILYRHYAIDDQHPMAVDPQTWLELYRWYDPVVGKPEILFERRATPRCGEPVRLGGCTHPRGRTWVLPNSFEGPLLVKVRFTLSAQGAALDKLFRVLPPCVTVTYQSGDILTFRVGWRNLAEGFIASDLPTDAAGAVALIRDGRSMPVTSLTFCADPDAFAQEIELEWFRLPPAGSGVKAAQ